MNRSYQSFNHILLSRTSHSAACYRPKFQSLVSSFAYFSRFTRHPRRCSLCDPVERWQTFLDKHILEPLAVSISKFCGPGYGLFTGKRVIDYRWEARWDWFIDSWSVTIYLISKLSKVIVIINKNVPSLNWSACLKLYACKFRKAYNRKLLTGFWRFNRFLFSDLWAVFSVFGIFGSRMTWYLYGNHARNVLADVNSASARYQDLNGKRLARLQFIRSVV